MQTNSRVYSDGGRTPSWQFLGDLPYRKVTLYEHVRWRGKPNVDSKSITRQMKKNHTNDVFAQQQHNQEKQYGLACLPSRKTMSQQYQQPKYIRI
jgi:hypothetical protein